MKKMSKKVKLVFIYLFITLLLVEVGSIVLIYVLDYYTPPSYTFIKKPKSVDIDSVFGVWHTPNYTYDFKGKCFSVKNSYNSYGARDRERQLESNSIRIINIGDSFMEGYGIDTTNRMSNFLERELGYEVLNFSTSGGFGSTQMRLLYESLASSFSHDILLIGLFPHNDFDDDNYELGKIIYGTRYRPYLVDQKIIYHQKKLEDSKWYPKKNGSPNKTVYKFFYNYTHIGSIIQELSRKSKLRAIINSTKAHYKGLTRFRDFSNKEFDILKQNILEIKEHAGPTRKILIFAIPSKLDMIRYFRNRDLQDVLGEKLTDLCTDNMIYIDLLGSFKKKYDIDNFNDLFLSCDGHWSDKGHLEASKIIIPHLQSAIDSINNQPISSTLTSN